MGNILFAITLGVLSLNFFTISYRLTGINRLMYNIPISIFETSIPLVQDTTNYSFYYDKEVLETKLTSYFDKSIYRYTDEYSIDYYYYNQSDYSICKTSTCDAIEITLEAKINLLTTYSKTARFYIHKN